MPDITIRIDDLTAEIITQRATKNHFTLAQQIQDILRLSALRTKSKPTPSSTKVDDKLVNIFSRDKTKADREKEAKRKANKKAKKKKVVKKKPLYR